MMETSLQVVTSSTTTTIIIGGAPKIRKNIKIVGSDHFVLVQKERLWLAYYPYHKPS